MPDRLISEVIGCQSDDLRLVDNEEYPMFSRERIAPAYAYREVHEAENDEAHGRMTIVAILLLIVFAGLAKWWIWPGIRDGMTRAEMAQGEGR